MVGRAPNLHLLNTRRFARDCEPDLLSPPHRLAEHGAIPPAVPGEGHAALCLLAQCLTPNSCVCLRNIILISHHHCPIVLSLKVHAVTCGDQSTLHQPVSPPSPPDTPIIGAHTILLQPPHPSILTHVSARPHPPVPVQTMPGDAQCVDLFICLDPGIHSPSISPLLGHHIQTISTHGVDHRDPGLTRPVSVLS